MAPDTGTTPFPHPPTLKCSCRPAIPMASPPRPLPRVRPLFVLFLSLLFLVFLLPWAVGSSLLESSHLYRVLDIQERERLPPAVQVAAARGLLARLLPFHVAAARGLLARLLPSHVSSFQFEMVSKVADVFIANFSCLGQTIK
ncbi:hypothetical protein BHE74_00032282 [Ensete ventricosum]|nr:hypothetical protein GW17_00003332 [Ensete ventricosum]RWW60706.1 hypothetical protein BHE74_00032282 [Ensete ventricosum]RZS10206.1 hypothetical protein BHM03_00041418 [Ensete ventricosum]